jgi:tetratricopeptide (TPR) repeat protein
MKKWLILVAAAAIAAGAYALWTTKGRPEWTTDSKAALAAYQRGRQAQMKFYFAEAAAAYEEALAHDPDFVAARIALLDTGRIDRDDRESMVAKLRAADRSRLNERERFLLDVVSTDYRDQDARRRVVEEYLERNPRDPWALLFAAGDAWNRQDWPVAERRYRELLEIDPNWVQARNNLGYIAMAQGRFDQAEEQFRTYRYAAPDQANPHDSLGELYVLIGRYEEARTELEAALAVRPDFCASYENLFRLALLDRRPQELEPLASRVAEHCDPELAKRYRCQQVLGLAFLGADANAPWTDERCRDSKKEEHILTHTLALRTGRIDEALAIERQLGDELAKAAEHNPRTADQIRAGLRLLEGQRLLSQGRAAEAVPKLREMDSASTWWGAGGSAVLKLVALETLAEALEKSGDAAGAEEVRTRLRAVNPEFERDWRDLSPLGPPAG